MHNPIIKINILFVTLPLSIYKLPQTNKCSFVQPSPIFLELSEVVEPSEKIGIELKS
jgi:hypothetical protein